MVEKSLEEMVPPVEGMQIRRGESFPAVEMAWRATVAAQAIGGSSIGSGGKGVDALRRPPRPLIKRRMETQTGLSGLNPDTPV